MAHWTILDFADELGESLIRPWLLNLPTEARAAINQFIIYLETMTVLRRPYTADLDGECDGLFELRIKAGRVQYRPLACYGPRRREITILFGAVEKGGRFVPRDACTVALTRKGLLEKDRRRACAHRFD